jgi:hypothetical protein
VVIRNTGASQLSALSLNYSVNGGEVQTYIWNGILDYLQRDTVSLPAITFDVEEENALTVACSEPNGGSDECGGNDHVSATIVQGAYTLNTVKLLIRTDANPHETTWEVLNSSGEVLYQGGPYSVAGQMINETFELAEEDCHTFRIYDAGGNGFAIPGFYLLYHGSNDVISDGIGFGPVKTVDFNTTDVVGITESPVQGWVQLFPNPASTDVNIDLDLAIAGKVRFVVSNLTGKQVYAADLGTWQPGRYHEAVSIRNLAPGLYFYTIRSGAASFTGKLVIAR